jgi:TonB family protein
MSEHHPHGASTIRASKSGGAGKWLLGGLAAIVIAGGGYAAYKMYQPGQQTAQSAYEDTYDAERAAPLQSDDDLSAESAAADNANVETAAPAPRAPARRQTAQAVPETTIGVTPINVTTDETVTEDQSEEVVVNPPLRPVWSRTPSAQRLTTLYPERARMRGREGEARLACTVQSGGALDCTRVEESSSLFGAAAMRVASTLRHAPQRADGADATGTPVNLRVVFRLEDERGQRFAAR